jgi:hypothetical protein
MLPARERARKGSIGRRDRLTHRKPRVPPDMCPTIVPDQSRAAVLRGEHRRDSRERNPGGCPRARPPSPEAGNYPDAASLPCAAAMARRGGPPGSGLSARADRRELRSVGGSRSRRGDARRGRWDRVCGVTGLMNTAPKPALATCALCRAVLLHLGAPASALLEDDWLGHSASKDAEGSGELRVSAAAPRRPVVIATTNSAMHRAAALSRRRSSSRSRTNREPFRLGS